MQTSVIVWFFAVVVGIPMAWFGFKARQQRSRLRRDPRYRRGRLSH
jgi:ABC-type sulfate transport system permease component